MPPPRGAWACVQCASGRRCSTGACAWTRSWGTARGWSCGYPSKGGPSADPADFGASPEGPMHRASGSSTLAIVLHSNPHLSRFLACPEGFLRVAAAYTVTRKKSLKPSHRVKLPPLVARGGERERQPKDRDPTQGIWLEVSESSPLSERCCELGRQDH